LAIVFGEKDNLPEADLEAVEQYGWKVAGRKAYPAVYRKEPGLTIRPPLVWELELLEGCLRAVPDFVKHPSTVSEIDVAVATGELPLKLSWVEEVPRTYESTGRAVKARRLRSAMFTCRFYLVYASVPFFGVVTTRTISKRLDRYFDARLRQMSSASARSR
jgi:hypothetical protein